MAGTSTLYPRIAAVRAAFEDPAVREEFERWRAERAAAGKQLRAPSSVRTRRCAPGAKHTPTAAPTSR